MAPTVVGVWGRVVLGVALAVGLTQWPYRNCGLSLWVYLAGATMVVVAGVWAARASWRAGLGWAHVVAILILLAGTALAAHQVMPRLGYAPIETGWRCTG